MEDFKDKLVFDQSPDKFLFNSLFNLISRIYQAAITNYKQTRQQVKAANYLEQCAILSLIQKYVNVTLEPFQVQFNDDDTFARCVVPNLKLLVFYLFYFNFSLRTKNKLGCPFF